VQRVYSTRFLLAAGSNLTWTYTVPSGRIAVVRSITSLNGGVAGQFAIVSIAGTAIYVRTFPATNQSDTMEMRQVVYGGETIGASLSGLYMTCAISGYLFDDLGAEEAPPASTGDLAPGELEPWASA